MADDVVIRFLEHRSAECFDALVTTLQRDVHAAAFRVVRDASLADDVAQDVFERLLRSRLGPGDVTSGKGFVHALAVRVAKDAVKSRDRRRRHEAESGRLREETSGGETTAPEDLWGIREAIRELPGDLRSCVELHYYGGLPVREIAAALRLAPRSVQRRLQDGRERLHARLSADQRALVLPVLDGLAPPYSPSVSEEHLAQLQRSLAKRAEEHFATVADGATSGVAEHAAAPDAPPPAGDLARSHGPQRRTLRRRPLGRRGRVRSIAFYTACVFVAGGAGVISWWLGTDQPELGDGGDLNAPLAVAVQEQRVPAERVTAPARPGGGAQDQGAAPRSQRSGAPALTAHGLPAVESPQPLGARGNGMPAAMLSAPQQAPQGIPDISNPTRFPPAEVRRQILFEGEWGRPLWGVRLYGAEEKPKEPLPGPHVREVTLRVGNNPRRFAIATSKEWRDMATGGGLRRFPRRLDEGVLQRDGRLTLTLPNSGESVIEVHDAARDQAVPIKFVASAHVDSSAGAPLATVAGSDGSGTLHGVSTEVYSDVEIHESGYYSVRVGDLDLVATKTVWLQPTPTDGCATNFMVWDGADEFYGARVVVIHRDTIAAQLSGDAYYACEFDGLVPGDYRFEVHAPGPSSQEPAGAAWWGARLEPKSGGSFSLDLQSRLLIGWGREPKFTFRILNTAGRPVPDVDVLLDRGWQRLEGGADAGGTYEIPAAGYFSIALEGETRWMLHSFLALTPVEQKKPTVYEFIYGSRTVRGQLRGWRGEAPQHVLLVTKTRSSYADVEADGSFRFTGVVEGNHLLLVFEQPGSWLPLYRTVVVQAESDPAPIDIRLDELAPVWAVLPAPTRARAVKEKVVAVAEDDSERELRPRYRGTKGREFFGLLPSGQHRIEVRRGAGAHATGIANVRTGVEETVELEMITEQRATGQTEESAPRVAGDAERDGE